jgi:2-iminoacetate synthase
MSFFDVCRQSQNFDFQGLLNAVTANKVRAILNKDYLSEEDFLSLLSPAAEDFLEEMAQKVHRSSLSNFGKSILLYTPMYISNYCVNKCSYCGYNVENNIRRKKLSLQEVEEEAKQIQATGLRHILLLAGESRFHTPLEYIKHCVKILKRYFSSISIEIYPLEEAEYKKLVECGVDGLTIYQETYDMKIYDRIHIAGPKKDYKYRIETPERACKAGIRSIGVGALYGLGAWRQEAFFSGLHTKYIEDNFPYMEISMSVPRMRPHTGSGIDVQEVTDKNMVQIMLALKLYVPRAGINITTRESQELRDNLIPLGVTKMSAGVSTAVGGHSTENHGDEQFEIADSRSVEEIKVMLQRKGYCPVFKDWEHVV